MRERNLSRAAKLDKILITFIILEKSGYIGNILFLYQSLARNSKHNKMVIREKGIHN